MYTNLFNAQNVSRMPKELKIVHQTPAAVQASHAAAQASLATPAATQASLVDTCCCTGVPSGPHAEY